MRVDRISHPFLHHQLSVSHYPSLCVFVMVSEVGQETESITDMIDSDTCAGDPKDNGWQQADVKGTPPIADGVS